MQSVFPASFLYVLRQVHLQKWKKGYKKWQKHGSRSCRSFLCTGVKTAEWTVLWREGAQMIRCYPDLTQSNWDQHQSNLCVQCWAVGEGRKQGRCDSALQVKDRQQTLSNCWIQLMVHLGTVSQAGQNFKNMVFTQGFLFKESKQ